jgi:alanyl-tRNA synthetase
LGGETSLSIGDIAFRNSSTAGQWAIGSRPFHYQTFAVVDDHVRALDFMAIDGALPLQEIGVVIQPMLGDVLALADGY